MESYKRKAWKSRNGRQWPRDGQDTEVNWSDRRHRQHTHTLPLWRIYVYVLFLFVSLLIRKTKLREAKRDCNKLKTLEAQGESRWNRLRQSVRPLSAASRRSIAPSQSLHQCALLHYDFIINNPHHIRVAISFLNPRKRVVRVFLSWREDKEEEEEEKKRKRWWAKVMRN